MKRLDVLVIGMGFAGITAARILADAGHRVHLAERRDHIGGNAYDHADAHGVLVHRYGPHIFHTNARRIVDFLSRFTAWRPYEHRVLAQVGGKLLPFPVNRTRSTRSTAPTSTRRGSRHSWRASANRATSFAAARTWCSTGVGRDLCEKFFRGYTRKQWGLDLAELAASVAARVPARTSDDDRYFEDRYQCMPADGYTAMFERMLDHPLISVRDGRRRLRRRRARGERAASRVHRTDRCLVRPAIRRAAVPVDRVRARAPGRRAAIPGGGHGQLSRTTTPSRASPNSSTSPDRQHAGTSIVREYPTRRRGPVLPDPARGQRGAVQALPGAGRRASPTSRSSDASRSTGTTTWTRRSARRWRRPRR